MRRAGPLRHAAQPHRASSRSGALTNCFLASRRFVMNFLVRRVEPFSAMAAIDRQQPLGNQPAKEGEAGRTQRLGAGAHPGCSGRALVLRPNAGPNRGPGIFKAQGRLPPASGRRAGNLKPSGRLHRHSCPGLLLPGQWNMQHANCRSLGGRWGEGVLWAPAGSGGSGSGGRHPSWPLPHCSSRANYHVLPLRVAVVVLHGVLQHGENACLPRELRTQEREEERVAEVSKQKTMHIKITALVYMGGGREGGNQPVSMSAAAPLPLPPAPPPEVLPGCCLSNSSCAPLCSRPSGCCCACACC